MGIRLKLVMKFIFKRVFFVISLVIISACDTSPIEHLGINKSYQRDIAEFIPETELKLRQATISDLYYEVNIDLTQFGRYAGMVELRFMYQPTEYPLTIDFADGEIERILLNNKPTGIDYNGQFLTIPASQMSEGTNRIKIQFSRAFVKNKPGLNHFYDTTDGKHYLFNKSELQDEHHLFPMFNQDDLPLKIKAIFTTDKDWSLFTSLATEKVEERGDFKLWYFQTEQTTTQAITLLAGEWYEWKGRADGKQINILVRQSSKESIPVRRWYQGIQNATKPLSEYFGSTSNSPLTIALLPGLYDYKNSTQNILSLSESPLLFQSHMSPAWHRILTQHEIDNRLKLKQADNLWMTQWLTSQLASELYPTLPSGDSHGLYRLQPSMTVISNRYPDTYVRFNNQSLSAQKASRLLNGLAALSSQESVSESIKSFLTNPELQFTDLLEGIRTLSSFNAISWSTEWLNKPGMVKLSVTRRCNQTGRLESLTIQQITQQAYPVVRPLKLLIENPLWENSSLSIDMTSDKKVITDLPNSGCTEALIISSQPALYIASDNKPHQLRQLAASDSSLNLLTLLNLAINSSNNIETEELEQWLHLIRVRLETLAISDTKQLIHSIKPLIITEDNENANVAMERMSNRLYQLSLNRSVNADTRIAWFLLHLETIDNDAQLNRMLAWLFGNSQPTDLQGIESLQLAVIELLAQRSSTDTKLILDSFESRGNVIYKPYLEAIRSQSTESFDAVAYIEELVKKRSEFPSNYSPVLYSDNFVKNPEVIRYSLSHISELEQLMSGRLLQLWLEPHLVNHCSFNEAIEDSLARVDKKTTQQATRDWLTQVLVSCEAKQELAIH